ncbi:MAG: thioesterase [Eubacteriales bacterium]|nr:thioesterase [Eubacteriales bacterium]
MDQPFQTEVTLDMSDVDFTGHWQPGAIFRAMQYASNLHCDTLNLTYEHMLQQGLAWVLNRARLVMDEYPVLGDTVTIHTWPTQNRHTFFPRQYTFHCHGREIGRATTLYVLLDIATRKIAPPSRMESPVPSYDIAPPLPLPGNISLPQAQPESLSYLPVYTDFDMNRHVNNTKYIDWFMNRFPTERHDREELADLLIHYNFEIRAGELMTLCLWNQENHSVLHGLNGDQVSFAIQGLWRPRTDAN